MLEKPRIAKLAKQHDTSDFDCGNTALNDFIRLHALQGQRSNVSQTYVAASGDCVVGFHTLVVGNVSFADAPERLAKGIPRHPIPILLLARLAVDQRWQGKGLGAALVADAIRRTVQVADIAGVRALLVHATDSFA